MNIATKFDSNINTTANIACLNPLASIQVPGASDDAFNLTPEALLAYCSSRLDSIDQKIQSYFNEQQKKNLASKQLGVLQGILGRTDHQKKGGSEGFDSGIHASESNEILKVYREATDPAVKKAAAEAFKLRSGYDVTQFGPTESVTVEDIEKAGDAIVEQEPTVWAQRIENIKSEATNISKSAELNMIQLQSLVSQRQLAVQLTTQLMQSLNESMKNITANVRA